MGFILEKKQPRLTDAVYINIYLNRAGIDFFALIKLVKLSLLLSALTAIVAMSIRQTGFVLPSDLRVSRYSSYVF